MKLNMADIFDPRVRAERTRRAGIKTLIEAGAKLEDVLAKLPVESHATIRASWAAVEGRKKNTLSFAVRWIAEMDEASNMEADPESPDYIGGQATVLLVAAMFGKDVHEVVEAVVAERHQMIQQNG